MKELIFFSFCSKIWKSLNNIFHNLSLSGEDKLDELNEL